MDVIPTVIGNCRLEGRLGQGGMGMVFRAVHQNLGRQIALKVLPPEFTSNAEYVVRFLREARAVAALTHPNVVAVFDAGEQNGLYYITMEYVNGASLGAVVSRQGTLPEAIVLGLMAQAAKGLGAAHSLGLIHRDIKPENLLVTNAGVLKIVDFGLVLETANEAHLTRTGAFLGTPACMSPEQCDGELADGRSDLYSLGVSFYQALTGLNPFSAPTALGYFYKHKFEQPADPRTHKPQASAVVSQILMKCLAKDRAARYQDTAALLADVEAALKAVPPAPADWSWAQVVGECQPKVLPLPDVAARPLSDGSLPKLSAGTVDTPTRMLVAGKTGPLLSSQSASSSEKTLLFPSQALPGSAAARHPRRAQWLTAAAVGVALLGSVSYWWAMRTRNLQRLERYCQTIQQHIDEQDDAAALHELDQALKSFPDSDRLQEYQVKLKDVQAHEVLQNAEAIYRKRSSDDLVQKALAARQAGDWDTAIGHLEAAVRLKADPTVQSQLRDLKKEKFDAASRKAEAAGNWKEALSWAEQAVECGGDQGRVEALSRRVQTEEALAAAQAAEKRQDWEAVVVALQTVQKLDPAQAGLKARLEEALRQRQQGAQFQSELDQGLAALKAQQWATAREHLAAALQFRPNHPEAQARFKEAEGWLKFTAAEAAQKEKQWPQAVAALREAQELLKDAAVPVLKAQVESALAAAERQVQEIERQEGLAQTASRQGNLDQAAAAYRALLALNPSQRAKYEAGLAAVQAQQSLRAKLAEVDAGLKSGDFGGARRVCNEVLAQKPDPVVEKLFAAKLQEVDGAELLQKGEAHAAAKEWDLAQADYAAAQKALPPSAQELTTRLQTRLQETTAALTRAATLEAQAQAAFNAQDWEKAKSSYAELAVLHANKRAVCQQALAQIEGKLNAQREQAQKKQQVEAHLAEAQRRVAQGDSAGALTEAEAAQALDPSNPAAKLLVTQIKAGREFAEGTIGHYDTFQQHISALVAAGDYAGAALKVKEYAEWQVRMTKIVAQTREVYMADEVAALGNFGDECKEMALALTPLTAAGQTAGATVGKLRAAVTALAQAPLGAAAVRQALERAQEAARASLNEANKAFAARNYFKAKSAAAVVSSSAPGLGFDALNRAVGDLEKLAADAQKGGDAANAGKYTGAAQALRPLMNP